PTLESVFDSLKEHLHFVSAFPRSVHGSLCYDLSIMQGYQRIVREVFGCTCLTIPASRSSGHTYPPRNRGCLMVTRCRVQDCEERWHRKRSALGRCSKCLQGKCQQRCACENASAGFGGVRSRTTRTHLLAYPLSRGHDSHRGRCTLCASTPACPQCPMRRRAPRRGVVPTQQTS